MGNSGGWLEVLIKTGIGKQVSVAELGFGIRTPALRDLTRARAGQQP